MKRFFKDRNKTEAQVYFGMFVILLGIFLFQFYWKTPVGKVELRSENTPQGELSAPEGE